MASERESERPIKVVINGYPGNGRTSLLMTMANGQFPDEHAWVPMCHDNITIVMDVPSSSLDGPLEPTSIDLWDTMAGDYDCIGGLISLSFPQTDIFLLCFAVCDPLSIEQNDYFIDLYRRHQVDGATIVFVGTKTDVVESPEEHPEIFDALKERNLNPLTKGDLVRHAQEVTQSGVRISGVCMCSALTGKGVKNVLMESIRLLYGGGEEPKKPKKCSIQ